MRGTLTADEVYALTAYLLVLNKVIPEDAVWPAPGSVDSILS